MGISLPWLLLIVVAGAVVVSRLRGKRSPNGAGGATTGGDGWGGHDGADGCGDGGCGDGGGD